MEACGRIWGGAGSVAGGGEGTVRPCLGVWVCRGCGWWAVRRWVCWRRGRHVGGGCGGNVVVGGERGEGTESNKQEGAPPNADPGGSADKVSGPCGKQFQVQERTARAEH